MSGIKSKAGKVSKARKVAKGCERYQQAAEVLMDALPFQRYFIYRNVLSNI